MKALKLLALSAAMAASSAFAIDFNWGNHDPVETFSYTHHPTQGTFADDARFIVTNGQSTTMRVEAKLLVTQGSFSSLVIEFWGDYYGPDQLLATFAPGETFSFPLLNMRKKYYYLIRGQAAPGGTSGWTLTSHLLPK
jgi:hypothetical protein